MSTNDSAIHFSVHPISPRPLAQAARLKRVLYEIRGPVAARAAQLEREGQEVLRLNIGNPEPFGFAPPRGVSEYIAAKVESAHGYTESRGLARSRQAVVERYRGRDGFPEFGIEEVFLGNGVSELIPMVLQALVDPGDEILIPSPDYPLWTAMVSLTSGVAVHYRCREELDWAPDLEAVEAAITGRTKALVVINPNNPTGAVYPREVLEGLADIARRHGLLLLADEIYDEILYDDAVHTSVAEVAPDLLCLTFNGLSKSCRIAGYRAAWLTVTGDRDHARGFLHGLELLAATRLCPNLPGQFAIEAALGAVPGLEAQAAGEGIAELCGPGGRLREQRDVAMRMLAAIPGVDCVTPRGALYAFPRLDPEVHHIHDDDKLVLDLLEAERIHLVQGSGFNLGSTDHLRIVLLPEVEVLRQALERLGNFLASYRQ